VDDDDEDDGDGSESVDDGGDDNSDKNEQLFGHTTTPRGQVLDMCAARSVCNTRA
jgi:hypothetical protein